MDKQEVINWLSNIKTPVVFTDELKDSIIDVVNEMKE